MYVFTICRSFSSTSSVNLPRVPNIQTLLKRGFTPTLKTINGFLLFLLRTRRFNMVIHFFSQLNSNKIKCNCKTCSILLRALLKSHKYEEAEHFMKMQLPKISNLSRNRMWDSLLQSLCLNHEDTEKALVLLRDGLRNHGILPSSFTFYSLIHRFSALGKMDKAIEVLELMTNGNVKYPFNNFVCSSVISGFCKVGKAELAVGFFENAVSSGGLQPNVVTYTSLVCALCKLGRVNEVYDLVSKIEKEGLAFDVVFYSCWVCGYITEGDLLGMFRKNKQMLKKGIRPDTITYTILIDGFSKLGSVEKVVGFLTKIRKDKLMPNLVTYTVIMLGFCKEDKMEEAFAIFKMVEDLKIEVDEFMYATLINGFCFRGDFDRVFHLLNEMEKKGIDPSVLTYNTVINGLCKFGRTSEADIISKDLHGDVITYSTLLHGYTMEENITGILETKKRLEDAGVCMDVIMCNVLIKALFMIGGFEDAYVLYKGMSKMGLVANSVTYCTMVDGYCNIGRIDEALEIFDEFRSTASFSVVCYNTIIHGLCKKAMTDMASEIFMELNEKALFWDSSVHVKLIKAVFEEKGAVGIFHLLHRMENLESDAYDVMCNHALCFLCTSGLSKTACEMYVMMRRKGSSITKKTYYSVLKTLVDDGKMRLSQPILNNFLREYSLAEPEFGKMFMYYLCMENVNNALRFLEKMKVVSLTVTVPVIVLKTLIKDGRALDAYKLFTEAENHLPPLDVFDFSIMVDGLCKGGYVTEALDFCVFAEKKGITLNIVCYNSVINGLCHQGSLVEAFRLFNSLEIIGLVPSEVTYATLIYALCRDGLVQDARLLFEKMILKGLKPNTRVYNSLIFCYSKIGQTEEAMKLLYDLGSPDEFTISAAINGYCQKGDMEEALVFYFEFKQKGVSPDFLGFLSLVRGLCAKGRIEEARNILREMLNCQSVMELINRVDFDTETESIGSFLVLLCEQGSIQEAVTVLDEVGFICFPTRRMSPDYDGLNKTHQLEGREDSGTVNSRLIESPKQTYSNIRSSDAKGVERVVCDTLQNKSPYQNFNFYYSLISSLCSKGEAQKASQLAKEILCNCDGA